MAESDAFVRGGDDANGFEMSVNRATGVLSVRVRGVWDIAIAHEYDRALDARYPLFGGSFGAMADIRTSGLQSDEVTEIRRECIVKGTAAGMKKLGYVHTAFFTQLQIRRMADAAGASCEVRFFSTPKDALAWLSR